MDQCQSKNFGRDFYIDLRKIMFLPSFLSDLHSDVLNFKAGKINGDPIPYNEILPIFK